MAEQPTVALCGAAGFAGRAMLSALLEGGYRVKALDLSEESWTAADAHGRSRQEVPPRPPPSPCHANTRPVPPTHLPHTTPPAPCTPPRPIMINRLAVDRAASGGRGRRPHAGLR